MRRREFLALSSLLLAGLPGCLSGSGTDATTSTADPPATTTAATERSTNSTSPSNASDTSRSTSDRNVVEASVSANFEALQPGVVAMQSADSIGVHPYDGQYLFLEVRAEGDPLPVPDDFSLRFGATTHEPVSMAQPWRIWRFYGDEGWKYDAASGEGLLLFQLPESADSSDVVLTWPGGEWRPDESLRRRLVTPEPPLSVSVEVPDAVPVSERPTVAVTVRNDGDVPGRFVAGLNRSGPMVAHTPVTRISFVVPAGGTEAWELRDDSILAGDYPEENVGDGDLDMTYYLSWPGDRVERDVRYTP